MLYKKSLFYILSSWVVLALFAGPARGDEKDRGTVKRPDYVATPHPEEEGQSAEDRFSAKIPNRSFAEHDHNGDGAISRDEWHGMTEDFRRLDANDDDLLSPRELDSYFQLGIDKFAEMDINHDGFLTQKEWRNKTHFFRKLDKDRDGRLTRNEFYF